MPYIVIQSGPASASEFTLFEDMESAVAHLEEICNRTGGENVGLYRLEPVEFEIKPYYKVEVPIVRPAPPPSPVRELSDSEPSPEEIPGTGRSEPVTASEAKGAAPETETEPEQRRGLFGR